MSLIFTLDIRPARYSVVCSGRSGGLCDGREVIAEWRDPSNNKWYAACWKHLFLWEKVVADKQYPR